jgi:hypothetical protein
MCISYAYEIIDLKMLLQNKYLTDELFGYICMYILISLYRIWTKKYKRYYDEHIINMYFKY